MSEWARNKTDPHQWFHPNPMPEADLARLREDEWTFYGRPFEALQEWEKGHYWASSKAKNIIWCPGVYCPTESATLDDMLAAARAEETPS